MTREPRPARDSAGFVIVGVVMFVLALTILGISLFGLSSYEAQLLGSSMNGHQAMYDCESGVQMVRAVLETPGSRLDAARLVEGVNGVYYACASQNRGGVRDSTGLVTGDTVTIQVAANELGEFRRLQVRYMPGDRENYYKRLFTVSDSLSDHVFANLSSPAAPNTRHKPTLVGEVWQNGPDSSWIANVTWISRPPLVIGGVPAPNIGGFIAGHGLTLPLVRDTVTHYPRIDINLTGPGTRYYLGGPNLPAGEMWWERPIPASGLIYNELHLEIQGTAVWMLPAGMRSDVLLTCSAVGPSATLVMVAGTPGPVSDPNLDPDTGIWWFGGMRIPDNVNVILVSNGRVALEFFNNPTESFPTARHLSVFASKIYLVSPGGSGASMDLRYNSAMDAVIDQLVSQNALPNAVGGSLGAFTMIPGSWRDRWP